MLSKIAKVQERPTSMKLDFYYSRISKIGDTTRNVIEIVVISNYRREIGKQTQCLLKNRVLMRNKLERHPNYTPFGMPRRIAIRSSNTLDQTCDSLSWKTALAYFLGISEVRDQPKNVRSFCRAMSMSSPFSIS